MQPNNTRFKRIPETHEADVECTDEMLEVIVNLMNFAGAMETVRHQKTCSAAPHVQDSDESHNWRAEEDNFWGNVLERLLSILCQKEKHEQRQESVKRARRCFDIDVDIDEPPPC